MEYSSDLQVAHSTLLEISCRSSFVILTMFLDWLMIYIKYNVNQILPILTNVANLVSVNGSCLGGGGAGGRVAIYYRNDKFTGTILSYGGLGYECGGAGTVLTKDTVANTTKLVVDNNNRCLPIEPNVDWNTLSDVNRGQNSFLTWLFDQDNTGHSHQFEVSVWSYEETKIKHK